MQNQTKHIVTLYLIIVALVTVIFLSGGDKKKEVVIIPEKTGAFKTDTLIPTPPKKPQKEIIKWKDKEVTVENPVNKELAIKYLASKDSIERLKTYLDAIKINNYNKTFTDENATIYVKAKTTGTLDQLQVDYKLKERTVLSPSAKETKFAAYLGAGLSNTKTLDQLEFSANLGIQNKKGDIISLQYGTNGTIQLGFSKRILNIKR